MAEKFKIQSPEQKPEVRPDVEVWEGEGGAVETQEESSAEVPETIVEEEQVKNAWQELIVQAKEEFPEGIKQIIDKASQGEKLHSNEISIFDTFAYQWFRETFGILKKKKQPTQKPKEEKPVPPEKEQLTKEELAEKQRLIEEQRILRAEMREKAKETKLAKLAELERQKRNKVEQLHRALRNLDNGEPVEEFRDETRRIVYFDEENLQYYVEENGTRKVLGIGDIISDYAWSIKYVPDGEMTEPEYRNTAKKILVNETRRDLEEIHNLELIVQKAHRGGAATFARVWPQLRERLKKTDKGVEEQKLIEKQLADIRGWVIEVAVREFLSRIGLNTDLNFVVSRATVEEDADYKYDFKVRVKHRIRGVDVTSKNVGSVGFQLKSKLKKRSVSISPSQKRKGVNEIDEIITLQVPGKEFQEAVKKWFGVGEPSGGPEQFLSPELKKAILKAVTEKLVDIPQDVFDKIQ